MDWTQLPEPMMTSEFVHEDVFPGLCKIKLANGNTAIIGDLNSSNGTCSCCGFDAGTFGRPEFLVVAYKLLPEDW